MHLHLNFSRPIVLLAFLLGGCVVDADDGDAGPSGGAAPDAGMDCAALYAPVCGVDGATYGNACTARAAGVEVAAEGECACSCREKYEPVCGANGQTFSNRCEAACQGAEVVADGECSVECACDAEYAPVCGVDGQTYGNACAAACQGVEVGAEGECGPSCEPVLCEIACDDGFERDDAGCEICACADAPQCDAERSCPPNARCVDGTCVLECACDDEQAPVCGAHGQTYRNACEAACQGAEIVREGACDAECAPLPCAIFCEHGMALDAAGCEVCECLPPPDAPCDADSACPPDAACVNGACVADDCACEDVDAPVCGEDGQTYGNACEAGCAGASLRFDGPCECTQPPEAYVVNDPDECGMVGIDCVDGVRFIDGCGCGCRAE